MMNYHYSNFLLSTDTTTENVKEVTEPFSSTEPAVTTFIEITPSTTEEEGGVFEALDTNVFTPLFNVGK